MEELQIKRHSLAHVLAKAVQNIFGKDKVLLTIGPAIDNGLYYDFDIEEQITESMLPKIQKEMAQIIKKGEKFERREVSREDALKLFANNPYKVELINELPKDAVISTYSLGEDFVDLCSGPHVEHAGKLQSMGFKVEKVNGAYWRGNEKNKMLQRVYVYAFNTKEELAEYITKIEEAKKRDHRKLGKELGLFFISDYAKGMPFFLPKGTVLKNQLIDFWREKHRKAGYVEIETPMAMNRQLWETSGHWHYYKDNMYTFTVEEEDFAIKPMNCPGGMLFYKENLHSYKEFPLRVAELGKVHRHEASGTLHGLFRVRVFTQDDAHIFMLPSQIESEIKNVLNLVDELYSVFKFEYRVELSTMPESHIGEEKDWRFAENALENALKSLGKEYKINAGDGAFYGPKIDIKISDALGREWQCGTIQLDMQLPKKFELEYTDENGQKEEPVMIHRALYGSLERMIGVLTEHFAGAFPVWLSPVQVKVISLTDRNQSYASEVFDSLMAEGIRAELDVRSEKVGYKIREALMQKIPYLIIVGDEEEANKTISLRGRNNLNETGVNLAEFVKKIKTQIETRELN
ncbi:MAG: threonine--tRNA ligase [Clostridia bacterium]|nr:threonine--tRNA ligase [Clostridia bacterium]